ncbi:MAG: lipid-transfer protein [Acidobacteria bacterium]|nr:lipid-transfer protein [Acidobacteriota bacterium]
MSLQDIAIVAWAEAPREQPEGTTDSALLIPIISEALEAVGLSRRDVGFWCSGSADYLTGAPFAFVGQLEATGAWPPINESHVEMDGAWALYEAWVRLHHGDIDVACVYAAGRPSAAGDMGEVLGVQLDPYYLQPLWPDHIALAALQADAFMRRTNTNERVLAEVVAAARTVASGDANAVVDGSTDVDELLRAPTVAGPLRAHDAPTFTDGAATIVLATADKAAELTDNPVWIRGIDHRIDAHYPTMRDLSRVHSASVAAEAAGVANAPIELAELSAGFSHQVPMLIEALGLDDNCAVNQSGGSIVADPMMVTGLVRIARAAQAITTGAKKRTLAHAASGPALQQNLVCVLEGGQ